MTRTVFRGGRVFDGSGADPALADVVIEGERIVDVGSGLDGDVAIDVTGKTLLPDDLAARIVGVWQDGRHVVGAADSRSPPAHTRGYERTPVA